MKVYFTKTQLKTYIIHLLILKILKIIIINILKAFNSQPSEITILAYDALGLIYYIWKKNGSINSINNFYIKDKIKGKIGTFRFINGEVFQELKIYKTQDKNFIQY